MLTKTNELARLQDIRATHKNQLHFYMLGTNDWKFKLKVKTVYNSIKNIKYLGKNLSK